MQTMKMKPAEFIALSACTMMLTAIGIDIMLPVFGSSANTLAFRTAPPPLHRSSYFSSWAR
ncbi:hypothetical protein [Paraflavitalea speifideaquila]|uniref:hypothetical protein n=1 Tax=Paraflavitalea speifideaquila TaxID=3076558 RepID=UPI0028EF0395|nr:hypothetical protein [Paraflavitalea speifideiaquila]